tara:strand:+ start:95 stop:568 length:474 start_codon:yes stop_codon:yes gene_type:complete
MMDFNVYWVWVKVHWKNVFYFLGSCAGFYSLYKSRPRLKINIEKKSYFIRPGGDGDYSGDYGSLNFEGHIRNEGSQTTSIIKAILKSNNAQVDGKELYSHNLFHHEIESSRKFNASYTFSEPPTEKEIKGKVKFYIAKRRFPMTFRFDLKATNNDEL